MLDIIYPHDYHKSKYLEVDSKDKRNMEIILVDDYFNTITNALANNVRIIDIEKHFFIDKMNSEYCMNKITIRRRNRKRFLNAFDDLYYNQPSKYIKKKQQIMRAFIDALM